MMQLPNMQMTSFRDEVLPDLIWLPPMFRKYDDRTAINLSVEFVKVCVDALGGHEKSPPLIKLSKFDELSGANKDEILKGFLTWPGHQLFWLALSYQMELFADHPLKFLFIPEIKKGDAPISELKDDVTSLLDRYGQSATKVQVTALFALAASGKLVFTNNVEIPDFDAVILRPDSDEAKRAASFSRAALNAGTGLFGEGQGSRWVTSFWYQSHNFEGCE
jgi:hypothetical protein